MELTQLLPRIHLPACGNLATPRRRARDKIVPSFTSLLFACACAGCTASCSKRSKRLVTPVAARFPATFPQPFPQKLWNRMVPFGLMAREKILVIEDEPDIAEVLQYNLEKEGFDVETARRGDTGFDAVRRDNPDLILLDL